MDEMSVAQLDDQICSLAARINSATAQLIALVGEFDARDGWAGYGVKSCAHWLSWKCQIGPHTAREQVRVARALRELTLISAEFAAGHLSYAKVRALTRIATTDSEADLVELAKAATAAQIERTVANWRRLDTLTDAERAERRQLSWHFDEHGMLHLKACLDTDEAAVLLAALESIATALSDTPTENAPQPHDATQPQHVTRAAEQKTSPRGRVDALTGLARAYLNTDADPRRDPDTQLVIDIDAQALERNAQAGRAAYRTGGRLTSEQARRLACDTALVTILNNGHEILDVGRSTRTVPAALRRALTARDRGCAMPGCTEHRARRLHAHHIQHWADGGPTRLENLVLLCKAHHHVIHHNGFTITAAQGTFTFRNPDGALLEPNPTQPIATLQPLPEAHPDTTPQWTGDPLDLDYVLTTLTQRRTHRQQQRRRAA